MSLKYYIINKPFGMLSQFTEEGGHKTLGDLYDFPKDVYPVGRLDTDSEGLLILTNDSSLNKKLLDPSNRVSKTYLAQVEGGISKDAIEELKHGVLLRVKKKEFKTRRARVEQSKQPSWLWERNPPIRHRESVPTSWVSITITEGKNRQVRRMTAAVGFPTLRLIRTHIGKLDLTFLDGQTILECDRKTLLQMID